MRESDGLLPRIRPGGRFFAKSSQVNAAPRLGGRSRLPGRTPNDVRWRTQYGPAGRTYFLDLTRNCLTNRGGIARVATMAVPVADSGTQEIARAMIDSAIERRIVQKSHGTSSPHAALKPSERCGLWGFSPGQATSFVPARPQLSPRAAASYDANWT